MDKIKLLQLERKYLTKKNPMSLTSLLLTKKSNIGERLYPKKIEGYTFVKTLRKTGSKREFNIGIYKNIAEKLLFVKSCEASPSSFAYKGLVNEVRSYIVIQKVLLRLGNDLPKDLQKVEIPEIYDLIEYRGCLYLFIEFKEGEVASSKADHEKIEAYFLVTRYLEALGKFMTNEEKKVFARRTVCHYAFLFPFLLILAIKNNPRHTTTILSGIGIFIKTLILLHKESYLTLIHRDLHFNNILINGNKVILIDFQLMAWGEILSEFATTMRYRWGIDGFENPFLLAIQNRFSNRKNFNEIFNGLMVNSATHGLIDNSFPEQTRERWLNLLKYTKNCNRQVKTSMAIQV